MEMSLNLANNLSFLEFEHKNYENVNNVKWQYISLSIKVIQVLIKWYLDISLKKLNEAHKAAILQKSCKTQGFSIIYEIRN